VSLGGGEPRIRLANQARHKPKPKLPKLPRNQDTGTREDGPSPSLRWHTQGKCDLEECGSQPYKCRAWIWTEDNLGKREIYFFLFSLQQRKNRHYFPTAEKTIVPTPTLHHTRPAFCAPASPVSWDFPSFPTFALRAWVPSSSPLDPGTRLGCPSLLSLCPPAPHLPRRRRKKSIHPTPSRQTQQCHDSSRCRSRVVRTNPNNK
jgi:hypothetical protein